jgi:small-conductance mechanosensitive channel
MGEGSGTAGGVAGLVLFGFVLLPALVAVLLFLFFTVMGMIKGTDFRAATLNVPILFTGVAVTVATIVVLLMVAAGVLGRRLTPKRRRKHTG